MKPILISTLLSITLILHVTSRPVPENPVLPLIVSGQASGVADPIVLLAVAAGLTSFGILASMITSAWRTLVLRRVLSEVVKEGIQEWERMERGRVARGTFGEMEGWQASGEGLNTRMGNGDATAI